ncbi:MAG: hypothetical protein ACR2KF_07035, partial [Nitrososphaeraceae archaeon]
SKPNTAFCSITKDGATTDYNCTYDTTTKKWSCVKAKTGSDIPNEMTRSETLSKMTGSQIPLGLKSALDSAKVKDQNGGLLSGESTTGDNGSSETKINNSPPPIQCQNCTMKQLPPQPE